MRIPRARDLVDVRRSDAAAGGADLLAPSAPGSLSSSLW